MNNTIQEFARKNLVAFAVLVVVVVVLSSSFIISSYHDVVNLFFAPFEFDMNRAIADHPLFSLELGPSSAERAANSETNIEEVIRGILESAEFDRGYDIQGTQMLLFDSKYSQSGKYMFAVTPDQIHDLNFVYGTTVTLMGMQAPQAPSHKYVICQLDGAVFFAKLPYDFDVKSTTTLEGAFVPYSAATIKDIRAVVAENGAIENFYGYQLDTTASFLFEQLDALFWTVVFLVAALWLVIALALQIKFCEKRPLYKKMKFMNGNIDEINEQLQLAEFINKSYVTKDWIITPQLFRTKITRNLNSKKSY